MQEDKLHKIVSKHLINENNYRIERVKYSNVLYRIYSGLSCKMILKEYKHESNFIRDKMAYKLLRFGNVKIPVLLDSGKNGTKNWILYKYVKGIPLCKKNINNDKSNCRLFYNIGSNLAKVHTTNFSHLLSNAEIKQHIKKRYIKFISGALSYKNLLVKKHPNYSNIFERAYQIIDYKKNLFLVVSDFTFVLGDVSPTNIIVKNNNELAAFIDLEYFMIENRYRDFILMFDYFDKNNMIRESFFKGYSQNFKDFKLSYDKLIIFLLHHRLENCVIANQKSIHNSIKRLTAILNKNFSDAQIPPL